MPLVALLGLGFAPAEQGKSAIFGDVRGLPSRAITRKNPPRLAALTSGSSLHAEGASPSRLHLLLLPIRDAGGANAPNSKEIPLTTRLNSAVRKYLEARSKGDFTLQEVKQKPTSPQPGVSVLLETEISRVQSGDPNENPYLLTSRLSLLTKPARLIGQWSGSAKSLRYLTANLSHAMGVSEYGLVGEIGNRVSNVLKTLERNETSAEFGMLRREMNSRGISFSQNSGKESEGTLPLRVVSVSGGTLSLLVQKPDGSLEDVTESIPVTARSLKPGEESAFVLTLPADLKTENSGSLQVIALVRRTEAKPEADGDRSVSNQNPAQTPNRMSSDSPVQVLDSGSASRILSETSLSRLLLKIRTEPADFWTVQILRR